MAKKKTSVKKVTSKKASSKRKVVTKKKSAKKKTASIPKAKKALPKKTNKTSKNKKTTKKIPKKKVTTQKVIAVATTLEEQAALNNLTQDVFTEFHEKRAFKKEKITIKTSKLIKIVLLSLLVIIVALFSYIKVKLNNSLAITNGELSLPGLTTKVTVYRDKMGVPLVEAKNEMDLFLATGFVMSQDRIWQMEIMRLIGRGELASLGGKKALAIDLFMRTVGTRRNAQKSYANLAHKYKKILQHFVKGINHFIESQTLPVEFMITGYKPKPWTSIDPLYVFQVLSLGLSNNFIEELAFLEMKKVMPAAKAAYLFPIYPDTKIPFTEATKIKSKSFTEINPKLIQIFEQIESYISIGQAGSNNWVLDGSKTKSGKVIVANDTHLRLSMPSAWMLMQLKSPEYSASGFMLPGVPLVALGYNGTFSWGATMVMADSQDLFIEQIKFIHNKPFYLYKGKWLRVKVRQETFPVKGEKSVTRKIYSTVHGPLINDVIFHKKTLPFQAPKITDPTYKKNNVKYQGIALAWAAHVADNTLRGIYSLAGAKTVQQMQQALGNLDGIYLNIVYGDKKNIGWQVTGRYPLRKKGTGLLPSPGHSGEYDWQGFLPYDKNPRRVNPPRGYIATANHRVTAFDSDINLSQTWRVPERMERIRNLLNQNRKADFHSTQTMQADQKSRFVVKFLKKYIYNGAIKLKNSKINAHEKAQLQLALNLLKNFDAQMKKESGAAALMGAFYHTINHKIFEDELGLQTPQWNFLLALNDKSYSAWHDHVLYRTNSPFWDDITTEVKENNFDIIAKALIDAYQLCKSKLGDDDRKWQWGKMHSYTWRHSITRSAKLLGFYLNRGPYPAGGDTFTLNNTGSTWGKDFDAWFTPAMRMITDFSKQEPFHVILTHGQSGNPSSNNYDNMIPKWLEISHHNLKFSLKNWSSNEKKRKLILQ